MSLMGIVKKARRDRWAALVVKNGKELREFEYVRGGIDGSKWPMDAAYLDDRINALERRRDSLLSKLKETA